MIARLSSISRALPPQLGRDTRPGTDAARIASRYAYNGTFDRALALRERYQAEQSALGHQAVQVIRNVWDNNINPDPFSESWPNAYPLLRRIILHHYRASAASAAKFYRATSAVQGRGAITVPHAVADVSRLDGVSDAVANGAFYHQLRKQQREPGDASLIARNSMSGAGARFALMGGRNTVMQMTAMDPQATGWERITEPDACAFCMQNAAKGPFSPSMHDFHPHDYCNCVAVPLFAGQKPANAEMKTQWQQVTQGKTGVEARVAWEEYNAANTATRDSSGQGSGPQEGRGDGRQAGRQAALPNA